MLGEVTGWNTAHLQVILIGHQRPPLVSGEPGCGAQVLEGRTNYLPRIQSRSSPRYVKRLTLLSRTPLPKSQLCTSDIGENEIGGGRQGFLAAIHSSTRSMHSSTAPPGDREVVLMMAHSLRETYTPLNWAQLLKPHRGGWDGGGQSTNGQAGIIEQERRLRSWGFLLGKHSSLLLTQVPGVGFFVSGAVPAFGRHPSWFITAGRGNSTHWWLYIGAAFTWGQGAKDC